MTRNCHQAIPYDALPRAGRSFLVDNHSGSPGGSAGCADPALKAEYLDIRRCKRKETTPINAFAIGDYFNPPTVEASHAEKYAGNPGDDI